jgi:hypothetical protein
VEILRARGFRARRLDEGMPDWHARGLEVAAGTHARDASPARLKKGERQ